MALMTGAHPASMMCTSLKVRSLLIAQDRPEVFDQRIHVDVFDWHLKRGIPVVAAPALGLSDILPIGSLVAGAQEAVFLHKGLEQVYWVPVLIYPVPANPPSHMA